MRAGHTHLFVPGAGAVPEAVRQAMNAPAQDPRSPGFLELTQELLEDLKGVFQTRTGRVMLCPGSGRSGWEAAITNVLDPGDKVLVARFGQFSSLWAEMAVRLGLDVEIVDAPWGAGAPISEIDRRLAADVRDEIKAVFVTHNETSTGVTSDVAAVRRVMDENFHDALLFVDGGASIGSIDFRMEDWGVDLAVTGSQWGMMLPAGLCILAASEKAIEAGRYSTMRRAHFGFADMLDAPDGGDWPLTPPTQLLLGLRAALDRIAQEGLPDVFARHHRLAEGVRRGVAAWGLGVVAEHRTLCSDTVTAIRAPVHVDARQVVRIAREDCNACFGAGPGRLAGSVFRIGHMGDVDEGMCLTALALAELALARAGATIRLGSGVGAAQAWFLDQGASAPRLRIAAE